MEIINQKNGIELLTSLPPEDISKILSKITNPVDILNLSRTSLYIKELLKISIINLDTLNPSLYIDSKWLSTFTNLEFISDNIIFDYNDSYNFTIPKKLKKFNIRFLYPYHISPFSTKLRINNLKNILITILNHSKKYNININEYTIRFIFNDWINNNNDIQDRDTFGFILDNNKLNVISKLTGGLFTETMSSNIDIFNIMKNIGYNIIKIDDDYDLNKSLQLNNPIIYKDNIDLSDIYYANDNFNEFIKSIYNLFMNNNIDLEKLLSVYIKTGYIHKKLAPLLVNMYGKLNKLYIGKSLKPDQLLINIFNVKNKSEYMTRTLNYANDESRPEDLNLNISNYYYMEPSLYNQVTNEFIFIYQNYSNI